MPLTLTHEVQHMPGFLLWLLFGRPRCSHNMSILSCVCITRPSRTWSTSVGMFHRSLLKARTHNRYVYPTCAAIRRYVHPASRRPTMRPHSNGWNCSTGGCTLAEGCILAGGCMVVPYSERCKHCSPLKAPQLLSAESKQRVQIQASRLPSDRRWPSKMNHNTTATHCAQFIIT